jgi:2-keto-4-pentenoate hydratase/2-oxohepta-3-ene-1,7-dioic acid hydratase in catechol pathway
VKLVLFNDFTPGLLAGDQVVDISPAVSSLGGHTPQEVMKNIIANFDKVRPEIQRLQASGKRQPAASVRLRAPLPRPDKILCCIRNYMEGRSRSDVQPLDMFIKSSESVIGPGDTVALPKREHTIFEHEAELGVVIGRNAHDVPAKDAMDYVFGYLAFVDVSARAGIGQSTSRSFLGKSYDTFCPIGPAIVTKDEAPDPQRLAVKLWVNGQLRSDYNTDDMEHPVPEVVEFASSVATLHPGDLIACGTNHLGLGPLQDGDNGEIEIEKIGRFSFTVSDPLKRKWPVPANAAAH